MIVSILYSQNSPFSNFRWRTQSCCNHHVKHCTEDHFLRLIVSDTIETGKPRIDYPRWGHSVVSWVSAKKTNKCTRVRRTKLVESKQKWIVECIRGCPGAQRPLVRPSTFACTRSFVVTPTISCKNIHTHKDELKIEQMVRSFAYTLLTLHTPCTHTEDTLQAPTHFSATAKCLTLHAPWSSTKTAKWKCKNEGGSRSLEHTLPVTSFTRRTNHIISSLTCRLTRSNHMQQHLSGTTIGK